MKKGLRKSLAVPMAVVVLFSTMSFTVDMHYCGDHLVDFSLSKNTKTCLMKAPKAPSSPSCSPLEMKMHCCSDVALVFEGQEDLKMTMDQLSFDQQVFLTAFIGSFGNRFEAFDENIVPFKDYAPPPLIRDIQALHQLFLI
jgi:hypothetical protein